MAARHSLVKTNLVSYDGYYYPEGFVLYFKGDLRELKGYKRNRDIVELRLKGSHDGEVRCPLSTDINAWIFSDTNLSKLIRSIQSIRSWDKRGEMYSERGLDDIGATIKKLKQLQQKIGSASFQGSSDLQILFDRGFDAVQREEIVYIRDAISILGTHRSYENAEVTSWIPNSVNESSTSSSNSDASYEVLFIPKDTSLYRSVYFPVDPYDPTRDNGTYFSDHQVAEGYARNSRGAGIRHIATSENIIAWKITQKNVATLKAEISAMRQVRAGPFILTRKEALDLIDKYAPMYHSGMRINTSFWLQAANVQEWNDNTRRWIDYFRRKNKGGPWLEYYGGRLFMRMICARGFRAVVTMQGENMRQNTHVYFHHEIFLCYPNTQITRVKDTVWVPYYPPQLAETKKLQTEWDLMSHQERKRRINEEWKKITPAERKLITSKYDQLEKRGLLYTKGHRVRRVEGYDWHAGILSLQDTDGDSDRDDPFYIPVSKKLALEWHWPPPRNERHSEHLPNLDE